MTEIANPNKWHWKMQYCKKHGIPPAQSWAWDEAEKAWQERLDNPKSEE